MPCVRLLLPRGGAAANRAGAGAVPREDLRQVAHNRDPERDAGLLALSYDPAALDFDPCKGADVADGEAGVDGERDRQLDRVPHASWRSTRTCSGARADDSGVVCRGARIVPTKSAQTRSASRAHEVKRRPAFTTIGTVQVLPLRRDARSASNMGRYHRLIGTSAHAATRGPSFAQVDPVDRPRRLRRAARTASRCSTARRWNSARFGSAVFAGSEHCLPPVSRHWGWARRPSRFVVRHWVRS